MNGKNKTPIANGEEKRPLKRPLLALMTVVIGVVFALLLAEVALRLGERFSAPHPIAYAKNSRGFRDSEHALAKKAGVLRIAFQGDSYTYGAGVAAADRFSERAGALLAARFPGRTIETLNFGKPGLNIAFDLEYLKEDVLPYDPDVIVFGLVLNDFDFPQMELYMFAEMRQAEAPYRPFARMERWSRLALFVDRVLINLFSDSRRVHIRFLNNIWHPETNPYYEKMRGHLYELVELISKRRGILVFFPYFVAANEKDMIFYKKAKRLVEDACRSHGCRFLEALPLLSHKAYSHWWVSPDDHHPNAEAHAIIGRAIAEAVAKGL